MSLVRRAGIAGLSLALGIALVGLPAPAQDSSPSDPAKAPTPATKLSNDSPRRVPPYFGQINLTAEQKESIYQIQAKHQQQIVALQRQLAEARASMLAECETVLDISQKQRLEERRRAATTAKKKAKSTNPTPTAATGNTSD